jgi:very-short-patch-repair endonuclease
VVATDHKIFNRKGLKIRGRFLRDSMATAEIILPSRLKTHQLRCLKSRRKERINNYIVDLHCPEKQLPTELDGNVQAHIYRVVSYSKRKNAIQGLGTKAVRFTNADVKENPAGIFREILISTARDGQPPLNPLLEKEGKHWPCELRGTCGKAWVKGND